MKNTSDACRTIKQMARDGEFKPSDLRRGEHFDIAVEIDNETDGVRVRAERCLGYGADAFYKADDVVIPIKTMLLDARNSKHAFTEAVIRELEFLMGRLRLAARPPKGWRLFGRRPRAVLA